jgi:pilus assembly protein CpaE
MSGPSKAILLLETDLALGDVIKAALSQAGYPVTVVLDPDAAIRNSADHAVVIVDVVGPSRDGPEVCKQLHATPSLQSVPILCISQTDDVEERIRFLEAGADDVIARPFDARELEARVEALLLRFNRAQEHMPVPVAGPEQTQRQRLIAVFSPKGGVGTTTIAVNTATLANQLHPERALIIDLDLQFGAVATHLNARVDNSLADLVRDDDGLRDADVLRSYVTLLPSGLHLIGNAGTPEYAQLVTAQHIERLLSTVATSYEATVVDAGSSLDERTLAVFEAADAIIIPIVADLGALRAMRTMVDYLNDTSSIMSKATVVLNTMYAKEPLRATDVESALGTKISLELPYDPLVYVKAINEGVPVIVGAPKSSAAERLSRLAGIALAGERVAIAAPAERRKGLGGLLRRSA